MEDTTLQVSSLRQMVIVAVLLVPSICAAQQSPTDATIAYWVVEALREDPRVRFSNIHVASEVRGVRSVRNEMEIASPNRRSDEEVARDIEAAMKRDAYLNTLPINISVNNGVVTLDGSVGNAYQRERATQEARRVENVIAIDNRLAVDWLRERGVRDEMPRPSDGELQSAVHAELDEDQRINASDIGVSAIGGHVTLRGSVGSFYEKQLATQSAMSVVGALWVSNLVAVRVDFRDDREIAGNITFRLQSDYLLRNQQIDVRVSDGAVTLSGTVNTANEKVHAADVAGRVFGARSINNAIEIAWTPKDRDAGIATRLSTRLLANWETRWVAGRIKVTVKSGKVILTGVVNTWGQWREAGRIAYLTEGVWSVDNQLVVDNVDYNWEEWFSDTPPVYFDAYPEYRMHLFERRF